MTSSDAPRDYGKWTTESDRFAVVAIPANNEADRIELCLSALATQRDRLGAPLASDAFEILVFANNCADDTVNVARALKGVCSHPVTIVSETLPPDHAHAGSARKRAMDLAAERLRARNRPDGVILTTDADSCVASTWVFDTLRAFAQGADCVAGYIDAHPAEIMKLGTAFMRRSRLEDQYLRAMAEIYAICDPRPHDPWPNHRMSSGASLALSLKAYESVGGVPVRPLGEDIALTHALECVGLKVRHALDVCVSTSCRLDGRVKGGAADTMRYRQRVAQAPCDAEIEPALSVVRRAMYKGRLRRSFERGHVPSAVLGRLQLPNAVIDALDSSRRALAFELFWNEVAAASPILNRRAALRPVDLPRQIARAQMALDFLRRGSLDCFADPDALGRG